MKPICILHSHIASPFIRINIKVHVPIQIVLKLNTLEQPYPPPLIRSDVRLTVRKH